MPKQVTTSTPKLFIGIDIHKKSWKVHFTTDITIGTGVTFPPSPIKLKKYVAKHFKKHIVCIAYEAGCCGFTAAREFEHYGWDTFVVNPADIPRPAKQTITKTDKIDARNIAKQLRAGSLKKIHIPEVSRECLRSLTRHRSACLKNLRRVKTQIKSLLLYYNIEIPEQYDNAHWSKDFKVWLTELEWNFSTIDSTLKSKISFLHFVDQQVRDVSTEMRAYCRKEYKTDYELLRSVPGIAGLTAAYIISEIGDIRRFTSFKKFAGFVGMMPSVYSSGDNESTRGVTPRANHVIRSLIVESSWVAIRKDPVIQEYYRKHLSKNSKAAIFKVARKLLSRVYAVIKSETNYQIGLVQ